MRQFPPDLQARLDADATTLCTCWRVERRDGAVQAFTDHDRPLIVEGVSYEPASGLESSAFEQTLGLSIGGAEVAGALTDASISDADLAGGAWDGARVEIRRVDWRAPEHNVLVDVAIVGEVRREGAAFVAELRSLAHDLDQERGRVYGADCDADLGDSRCGVALDAPPFILDCVVEAAQGLGLRVAPTPSSEAFFDHGRLVVLAGAAAGGAAAIREQRGDEIVLWSQLSRELAPGDVVRLFAGCDKRFQTCRGRFANQANFRGFPHMPGNDVVLSYAREGERLDGGSMFR